MSKAAALPEIDLVNRDPNQLNSYIQVEFNDAFGEPHGTHSADCVWRNSYKCFTCSKNLCYKILTYLCGIIVAFLWGCKFAMLAFNMIWIVSPCIRFTHVVLHPTKRLLQITLSTCVGPFAEAFGLFFSRIHVVQSTGPAPKPFGHAEGNDQK